MQREEQGDEEGAGVDSTIKGGWENEGRVLRKESGVMRRSCKGERWRDDGLKCCGKEVIGG